MSDEVLVKVDNLSKKFCRSLKRSLWYGVQDIAWELTGRKYEHELRKDEFWALKDVSFELKRGECLGLIGPNGAGKSTLLKMLNGLIKPDIGNIRIQGRIAALIELGAGFNPILTGRENIYVNASILGLLKHEVDRLLDKIIDFAELREFIDTPVQNYSSGMKVRLGFAIAAQIQPDVLIIDEVLAVGDRSFRVKCFNRMGELLANTSVILVSHSMVAVARICNQVCVLDKGKVIGLGDSVAGIALYNSLGDSQEESFVRTDSNFELNDFKLQKSHISWKENLGFQVEFTSQVEIENCIVRVLILDRTSTVVAEWRAAHYGINIHVQVGKNIIREELKKLNLRNDDYYVNFVLSSPNGIDYLIAAHCHCSFKVINGVCGNVVYQI